MAITAAIVTQTPSLLIASILLPARFGEVPRTRPVPAAGSYLLLYSKFLSLKPQFVSLDYFLLTSAPCLSFQGTKSGYLSPISGRPNSPGDAEKWGDL
jgi:hypothetical protein